MIIPATLIRPLVKKLSPYVPGEQPRIEGLVKLNTNENPYPPSPKVLAATRAAVDDRLRLYPNPTAEGLRKKLASLHKCEPEQIIVGNGSDEILALAVRTFVESTTHGPGLRSASRATVQYFTPSYSLYPVLAETHGSFCNPVPLDPGFELPSMAELRREKMWDFWAALTLVTTPNAPSGVGYTTKRLEQLCSAQKSLVLLDEAYVDFAKEDALRLALELPNVLVARTFSKAYSLCFQRVGYCVGHPELIGAMQKVRDSYNVNGLGQVAALATLSDLPYYQKNFQRIIRSREDLSRALVKLGFSVLPSQTNFILAHPPGAPAQEWYENLRKRKILVRWFDQDPVRDYLRISIGTPEDMEALLKTVAEIRT